MYVGYNIQVENISRREIATRLTGEESHEVKKVQPSRTGEQQRAGQAGAMATTELYSEPSEGTGTA